MIRMLGWAGGLAGAVALSQFPEFSQQYLQRLGGQADVLNKIEADFDSAATQAGLTREAALSDLSGTVFRDLHREDIRETLFRAERVRGDLDLLRAASPLERIALPHRFRDTETLAATWGDFRPGVPVTTAGFIAALIGFLLGVGAIRLILWLVATPFRRRAYAR
jgi:Protein of unknown function (DUF2937)